MDSHRSLVDAAMVEQITANVGALIADERARMSEPERDPRVSELRQFGINGVEMALQRALADLHKAEIRPNDFPDRLLILLEQALTDHDLGCRDDDGDGSSIINAAIELLLPHFAYDPPRNAGSRD